MKYSDSLKHKATLGGTSFVHFLTLAIDTPRLLRSWTRRGEVQTFVTNVPPVVHHAIKYPSCREVCSGGWHSSHAFNLAIDNSIAFVSLISECCLYSVGCREGLASPSGFLLLLLSRLVNTLYPVYWYHYASPETGSCGGSHQLD